MMKAFIFLVTIQAIFFSSTNGSSFGDLESNLSYLSHDVDSGPKAFLKGFFHLIKNYLYRLTPSVFGRAAKLSYKYCDYFQEQLRLRKQRKMGYFDSVIEYHNCYTSVIRYFKTHKKSSRYPTFINACISTELYDPSVSADVIVHLMRYGWSFSTASELMNVIDHEEFINDGNFTKINLTLPLWELCKNSGINIQLAADQFEPETIWFKQITISSYISMKTAPERDSQSSNPLGCNIVEILGILDFYLPDDVDSFEVKDYQNQTNGLGKFYQSYCFVNEGKDYFFSKHQMKELYSQHREKLNTEEKISKNDIAKFMAEPKFKPLVIDSGWCNPGHQCWNFIYIFNQCSKSIENTVDEGIVELIVIAIKSQLSQENYETFIAITNFSSYFYRDWRKSVLNLFFLTDKYVSLTEQQSQSYKQIWYWKNNDISLFLSTLKAILDYVKQQKIRASDSLPTIELIADEFYKSDLDSVDLDELLEKARTNQQPFKDFPFCLKLIRETDEILRKNPRNDFTEIDDKSSIVLTDEKYETGLDKLKNMDALTSQSCSCEDKCTQQSNENFSDIVQAKRMLEFLYGPF